MTEAEADQIRIAFRAYRELLAAESKRLQEQRHSDGPTPLFAVESGERTIIPKLERSKEFSDLLEAVFGDGTTNFTDGAPPGARIDVWTPVHHFLRRNGVYLRFLEALEVGETYSWEEEDSPLEDLLPKLLPLKRLCHLSIAPIELVEFAPEGVDGLAFPGFSICKFSRDDLERNLSNWIRRIHYPELAVNAGKLDDYWWIFVSHEEELENSIAEYGTHFKPSALSLSFSIEGGLDLSRELPSELRPFELPIRCLALHDWDAESVVRDVPKMSLTPMMSGGALFAAQPYVPFSTDILGSFFGPPQRIPVESFRYGLSMPYIPPRNNFATVSQEPLFRFSKNATAEFVRGASKNVILLGAVKDTKYQSWVDMMANRLVLGMQSFGASSFLEYVIAIEAALGSSKGSVQEGIMKRAYALLGLTRREQKALRKEFRQIYDFRSALVHGSLDEDGRIYGVHWIQGEMDSGPISIPDVKLLTRTRSLARRIVRAMLVLLNDLIATYGSDPPNRETILRALELAEGPDREELEGLLVRWSKLRRQATDSEV